MKSSTGKGIAMATFILLTKLSTEKMGNLHGLESMGRQWIEDVKVKCPQVKFIDHYALFGRYDFMDIYEAPDEETAAKVSLITMSKGAAKAETWLALPYKKIMGIANNL
jgi:uncharacterized protein with GYD domain